MGIAADMPRGVVRLDFGKGCRTPFPPKQAWALAEMLIAKADEVERAAPEPNLPS